jgi:hypothetical protein
MAVRILLINKLFFACSDTALLDTWLDSSCGDSSNMQFDSQQFDLHFTLNLMEHALRHLTTSLNQPIIYFNIYHHNIFHE